MKKGLTLSVVLLIVAAVLAVVGFVGKGDVQKELDKATANLKAAEEAAAAQKTDYEGKVTELTSQVAALTNELEAAKAAAPVKHGLGIITSIGSIADATAEKAGSAQVNTIVASVVLDAENKIQSVTWDVQQTKITFSIEGKPVDLPAPEAIKTTFEKGDSYGMRKASKIGKEWFEQIEALSQYAVGKTVEEVTGMVLSDVEELKASVTMSVAEYLAVLQKAADNAK